jgi:hypothetical protein
MLYIVAGRLSGCRAGSALVRAVVIRLFDNARFFLALGLGLGLGFAADFFFAMRPALRFILFGDLRFLDMQLTLRMQPLRLSR